MRIIMMLFLFKNLNIFGVTDSEENDDYLGCQLRGSVHIHSIIPSLSASSAADNYLIKYSSKKNFSKTKISKNNVKLFLCN